MPPVLDLMPMLLLDSLVKRYPTAKRQTLKRMVEEGRVRVNGRIAQKLKQELADSDKVQVDETARQAEVPAGPELAVVFEDEDILVVNKPPGLLTSTVPREKRETLLAMVRDYIAATSPRSRVGLIHRLDRDASGLLVFSKNTEAYDVLKRQLFERRVDRVYVAIVEGKPQEQQGRMRSSLVELPDGSVRSTKMDGKGQMALTEYLVLQQTPTRAMLRVVLHTGRKHQIRVHLSERGTPIVNDPIYGPDPKTKGRLMLASISLSLTHPRSQKRLTFETPIPDDLKKACSTLPAKIAKDKRSV